MSVWGKGGSGKGGKGNRGIERQVSPSRLGIDGR